jgi:hypothetical protein
MYKPKKDPRKVMNVRLNQVEKQRLFDLCTQYDESASAVIRKLIDERHGRVVK